MILQELVKCYDLMLNSDKFDVPSNNASFENVSFKFVIGEDGLIKQVLDLRENTKGVPMLVPYKSNRTGTAIAPYFLYDNSKYLLGYEIDKKSLELKKSEKHVEESKKLHMEILGKTESKYKTALEKFFDNSEKNLEIVMEKDKSSLEGGFIIFSLECDEKCIHEHEEIKKAFIAYRENKSSSSDQVKGMCLINGDDGVTIARTHKPLKGILGSSPSGAMLVSFNADSFESYKKTQSYNASISINNEFKYTTALNKLLSRKENRLYLQDNTMVFWSDKIGSKEEECFVSFMVDDSSSDFDAEYNQEGVDEIESILKLIRQGKIVDVDKITLDESINMYILGLYGSKSRVFVRYWFKDSIVDFIKMANKHFEDTQLKRRRKVNKKDFVYEEVGVKFSSILKTITPYGKNQNTPNTIINSLFKSILTGTTYPISVYNQTIGRIRAESGDDFAVNHTRVSFIKGYLKRYYRLNNFKDKEEEVTVSLNRTSTNVAYNLGRVFALLEKIQLDSNGSTNIREKYLSSASSTPKSIFPNLLNLAQYHISKIKKEGNTNFNYYDKVIGEILLSVDEFPSIFSSDDQGMFILGYYHQREDIYTSKKDREEN